MNIPISVDQQQLMDVLLNVASMRPIFIWGAPGIGKSSVVEQFAEDVGLPCVSLLGSQLAPILIITDGEIEDWLQIRRTHAYLLPKGKQLPFSPNGKAFYFDRIL